MEVIPAIDLRAGRCVSLYQGDYRRETVYSEEPATVAREWVDRGAGRIHVVDLDGARSGAPANRESVEAIVTAGGVPVQLGGGIRSIDSAKAAAAAGVDRVVVGTAAVQDPDLVAEMCRELGHEAIVAAVDARDGYVAVEGWTKGSDISAIDLVRRMEDLGVDRVMYTDTARPGTLSEPNFLAIERLVDGAKLRVMAAGGISTVEHLLSLANLGVEAAVVGKALYTGEIDLAEALDAVRSAMAD